MNARLIAIPAVLSALTVLVACGSSKAVRGEAKPESAAKGFSVDDRARCEWRGRDDREVSEATAAGSMQPNIRRVYQIFGEGGDRKKVLICLEVDTNLDGVKDVLTTYTEKGDKHREEADTNYDGKVDSWSTYANGRLATQQLDTDGDTKPNQWKFYTNGKLSRIQRDTNRDGNPDIWEIYLLGKLERVGVDLDYDGHVDRWDRDEVSRLATETRETASSQADGGASSPASPSQADAGASSAEAGQ